MQLNLRTAVYRIPVYVTTYYQQQTVVNSLTCRLNPPQRPGPDTLIFGGGAPEFEQKRSNSSTGSEAEQKKPHYSHAVVLVTTSTHVQQRTTGRKKKTAAPSADFGTGKQASLPSQLRRAKSFQGPALHYPGYNLDSTVSPNATADEARPFSPSSIAYSEPSSRSITRANTPSARVVRAALGFDSKHNWALAKPISNPSATVASSKPKKQSQGSSQDGIPLNDMSGILSPHDLERGDSPSEANLQVEVQVECEHDESGIPSMSNSSEPENAQQSTSQDGGIMATRIGA